MSAIAAWIGTAIAAAGAAGGAYSQKKGRKIARAGQAEQEKLMAKQREEEKKKLAEAEGEIGRRKALRQGGGRSMLMAPTSQQGSNTIGG